MIAFDRVAFDGKVGWAMDKALVYWRGQPAHGGDRGPNYGQVFEDQIQVYEWIFGQKHGAANAS